MQKAEAASGLVCDFPHTPERVEAFIANPAEFGVTRQQREVGCQERIAEHHQQLADRARARALTPAERAPSEKAA